MMMNDIIIFFNPLQMCDLRHKKGKAYFNMF